MLEARISQKNAKLLDSRTYWLMRPNDESRMDESNVKIAVELAREFGKEIGNRRAD